jgi:hypothetical protein
MLSAIKMKNIKTMWFGLCISYQHTTLRMFQTFSPLEDAFHLCI